MTHIILGISVALFTNLPDLVLSSPFGGVDTGELCFACGLGFMVD